MKAYCLHQNKITVVASPFHKQTYYSNSQPPTTEQQKACVRVYLCRHTNIFHNIRTKTIIIIHGRIATGTVLNWPLTSIETGGVEKGGDQGETNGNVIKQTKSSGFGFERSWLKLVCRWRFQCWERFCWARSHFQIQTCLLMHSLLSPFTLELAKSLRSVFGSCFLLKPNFLYLPQDTWFAWNYL